MAGVAVALAARRCWDAPLVGWVAVGLLVAALGLREASVWEGDGRGWLAMWGRGGHGRTGRVLASLAFG